MSAIPAEVAARIRRVPEPELGILEGSTPVVFFGNQPNARVATLGINPSSREFTTGPVPSPGQQPQLLDGDARRFETLDSLGIDSITDATDAHVEAIYQRCLNYFAPDPDTGASPRPTAYWNEWFKHLEDIIQPLTGHSYLNGTACHLDLSQWATFPLWGQLSKAVQDSLLRQDEEFLKGQLSAQNLHVVYLNGRSVCDQFMKVVPEAKLTTHTQPTPGAKTTTFLRGWYRQTKIIGTTYNIQSSRSNATRTTIKTWLVTELATMLQQLDDERPENPVPTP